MTVLAARVVSREQARRLVMHSRGPVPRTPTTVGDRISRLHGRLVQCSYRDVSGGGDGRWVVLRGSLGGHVLLDTNLSF